MTAIIQSSGRSISDVIAAVLGNLPAEDATPIEVKNQITVVRAELEILSRTAAYVPPEANQQPLWDRLGIMLYRYMPNTAQYSWAHEISLILHGS